MDGLIHKLGVEWTFRIIGILILTTGLPAAWMIKERAPVKTSNFVEWYVLNNSLKQPARLIVAPGASSRTSASQLFSLLERLRRSHSSSPLFSCLSTALLWDSHPQLEQV